MKKSIFSNLGFRYFFEVIVIVFSITASFYIQDLLNKKNQIELKNKALEGVLIELRKDREFLLLQLQIIIPNSVLIIIFFILIGLGIN